MLADLAFHMLILRVAGNRELLRVISERQIMLHMFSRRTDPPESVKKFGRAFFEDNFHLHQQIYDAIAARDAMAARAAVEVHTDRARENILTRYDWLSQNEKMGDFTPRDFPSSMQTLIQSIQEQFLDS